MLTMSQFSSRVKELGGRWAVTGHTMPDPDAVASAIIFSYYTGAEVVVHDRMRSDSKRLYHLAEDAGLVSGYRVVDSLEDYDHVIVVDASAKMLLPHVGDRRVDLVIDHHVEQDGELIEYEMGRIERSPSTVELVYDMIDLPIPPRLAAVMSIGIITDTARFSQGELSTFQKLVRLLDISDLSYNEMIEFINQPLSFGEREVILEGLTGADVQRLKNNLILAVSRCKSHESIVSSMLKDAGADLAIAYVITETGVRVSARLATYLKDVVDLPGLMGKAGRLLGGSGGGHPLAAGADGLRQDKVDEVISMIRAELERVDLSV